MGLSIGIIGLPNVGKSTIFNALTQSQNAEAENYPFCTIEPNKAIVPVPDRRMDKLAEIVNPESTIYATVEFLDIAGLVKGASKGEGLGNKFLSNIKETAALLHVIRCFSDKNVSHIAGKIDPIRDIEIVETELILHDIQALETRIQKLTGELHADKSVESMIDQANKLMSHMNAGNPAFTFPEKTSDAMTSLFREMQFLSDKKVICCANIDEDGTANNEAVKQIKQYADTHNSEMVMISAKMEEELADLDDAERNEFLASYGITERALNQTIRTGYTALGLIGFFTIKSNKLRAWTIYKGCKAPQAAGVIHTDFERGFIRAQVIAFDDYIKYGSESACKSAGVMRQEGKDYEVCDGDIIEFLFNA